MAKDGTARGGRRIGSGKKPTKPSKTSIHEPILETTDLPEVDDMEGVEVPEVKEYLKAKQKDGKDLQAEEIYKTTYLWLSKRNCEKLVSSQLIESYAMSVSRWIQCEEAISTYGFLAKHPTTGAAIASPYVQMSQLYMKQINACWYQIYEIIKENGSDTVDELDPQDLMMEQLLKAKKKY